MELLTISLHDDILIYFDLLPPSTVTHLKISLQKLDSGNLTVVLADYAKISYQM